MKLCDTCIYRNQDEYHKPCIVYRDDCEFYEKERGDMTDDLISREWLKTAIHNFYYGLKHTPTEEDIQAYIDVAPPVNQQEPKMGHWIERDGWDGDIYYECSVCSEPYCLIDGTPTDNLYNYCPNCGCRMQESEDKE